MGWRRWLDSGTKGESAAHYTVVCRDQWVRPLNGGSRDSGSVRCVYVVKASRGAIRARRTPCGCYCLGVYGPEGISQTEWPAEKVAERRGTR